MKKIEIILAVFCLVIYLVLGVFIGGKLFPVEKIVEVESVAPVFARILECESSNRHFGTDGQVLININTNKTIDIGKYQINTIWGKEATRLGYNLYEEKDNKTFALYLFKNYGTEPWYSTKKCWGK
ncbi:MAG: hypothetical protein WC499_02640 [Patescibacteria group bacterium]